MAKWVDFKWEPNVWYTMKMTVDIVDDTAHVKGKVWLKGKPEPDEWTITVDDPLAESGRESGDLRLFAC